MSFHCPVCGQIHNDIPHLGSDRPDMWWDIPEEERDRRIELTSETCIIDGEEFFIRGVIEIPVHDEPHPFGFGVWVSQKRENFLKYREFPDSDQIGPYFGWLGTRIDYDREATRFLKSMSYFRNGNIRPAILVEPTDHPLAVDQRDGITRAKAWEIVHRYPGRR